MKPNPEPNPKPKPEPRPRHLRLLTTANLFKACLLTEGNIPGSNQTEIVLDTISRLPTVNPSGGEELFTKRTWQSWMSGRLGFPKRSKVQSLDSICSLLDHNDLLIRNNPQFFEATVFEGLVSTLISPTRLSETKELVLVRAMNYSPISPIHLLLDAVDVAERTKGFENMKPDEFRLIAARRLSELLHEKWNPRNGYFYQNTKSDLRIQWEQSSAQEKDKIEREWRKINPNLFSRLMDQGASPNWNITGIQTDIAPQHVHRLLFCMSADRNFLKGERLSAWALDLASATLILFALAWSNRYETFGLGGSPESIFLESLVDLLFTDSDLDTVEYLAKLALLEGNVLDDRFCIETLMEARESLKTQLKVLGINPQYLGDVINATWNNEPLIYASKS